jgi:hypothetical protein
LSNSSLYAYVYLRLTMALKCLKIQDYINIQVHWYVLGFFLGGGGLSKLWA